MGLFSQRVLTDSINILANADAVWDFFTNLEENYISWHPEAHRAFTWYGPPMTTGSKWCAEELIHGKLFRLRGTVGEVVPKHKIVFKYAFPISMVSSKFEWIIEETDQGCTFTSRGYLNAADFYNLFGKKEMDWKIEESERHTREEGENLKRILERRKTGSV